MNPNNKNPLVDADLKRWIERQSDARQFVYFDLAEGCPIGCYLREHLGLTNVTVGGNDFHVGLMREQHFLSPFAVLCSGVRLANRFSAFQLKELIRGVEP